MLKKIKTFLENGGYLGETETGSGKPPHSHEEQSIAAAALLVEAAQLDGNYSEEEAETIHRLLAERFDLSKANTQALLEVALEHQEHAVELHKFTNQIKENFSHEERIELIEMLWEVAYADGVLHDYEANLLRRVGGLIHVTDRERGAARKRVLERLEIVSK